MADKQIMIDGVDVSECNFCEWKSSDIPQCRTRLASFEPTCKGYNCYYKQLKDKEQECDELKIYIESNEQQVKEVETLVMDNDRLINELDQLKAENGKMSKGYAELTEIVRPYIDDFTGYNEKLGGFDIVLCVKELLQQLDSLKAEVKSKTEYIQEQREIIDQYSKEIEMYKKCQGERASKREEGLKAENKKLKQTLTEIKEIAQGVRNHLKYPTPKDIRYEMDIILQKISEVISE